eukprot:c22483_g4_i1 orf=323-1918(-)
MACRNLSSVSSVLSEKTPWYYSSSAHLKEYETGTHKYFFPLSRAHIATCIVACLAVYFSLDAKTLFNTSHSLYALPLLVICICIIYILKTVWPLPCYLVDFCLTKGEDESCANIDNFFSFLRTWRSVTDANVKFQFKVFLRSGVGEESYVPLRLLRKGEDTDMQDARVESEEVVSYAARRVLEKSGVDPKEIDIVVVNSSLFNPSPSWTAYLVNVLKMRSNVKTFNLAGMGCSAGLLSIDLASRLLKVHRNAYALVVSTENITSNMYFGNDRTMMVSNCLFRCGCAAMLLTNKPGARTRAKMQLMHCLRTNLGADNKAYECVHQMEDDEGKLGVSLQMSLLDVAGDALRTNITKLAPLILPWGELIKVGVSYVKKIVLNKGVKVYDPNFKKAIDHFCIHPGGRAVIDSIGKGLKLSDYDVEPGKMALDRFGNTSSSGIWYALAYCEAKGRLKKGNKVWQIALGSGFKCNSGVWRVLRDIEPSECMDLNPWLLCVDRYPIPKEVVEKRVAAVKEFDALYEKRMSKSLEQHEC